MHFNKALIFCEGRRYISDWGLFFGSTFIYDRSVKYPLSIQPPLRSIDGGRYKNVDNCSHAQTQITPHLSNSCWQLIRTWQYNYVLLYSLPTRTRRWLETGYRDVRQRALSCDMERGQRVGTIQVIAMFVKGRCRAIWSADNALARYWLSRCSSKGAVVRYGARTTRWHDTGYRDVRQRALSCDMERGQRVGTIQIIAMFVKGRCRAIWSADNALARYWLSRCSSKGAVVRYGARTTRWHDTGYRDVRQRALSCDMERGQRAGTILVIAMFVRGRCRAIWSADNALARCWLSRCSSEGAVVRYGTRTTRWHDAGYRDVRQRALSCDMERRFSPRRRNRRTMLVAALERTAAPLTGSGRASRVRQRSRVSETSRSSSCRANMADTSTYLQRTVAASALPSATDDDVTMGA